MAYAVLMAISLMLIFGLIGWIAYQDRQERLAAERRYRRHLPR